MPDHGAAAGAGRPTGPGEIMPRKQVLGCPLDRLDGQASRILTVPVTVTVCPCCTSRRYSGVWLRRYSTPWTSATVRVWPMNAVGCRNGDSIT